MSDSSSEFLQKLDGSLDKFAQETGLPAKLYDDEVQPIMQLKREQLRRLTPDECGEGAFILRRFAVHLQRSYNREMAKVNGLDREIRKTVCREVDQHSGKAAEERREQAIQNNEKAKALQRYRDYHQARATELEYLAKTVGEQAQSLSELQQTKRYQRSN